MQVQRHTAEPPPVRTPALLEPERSSGQARWRRRLTWFLGLLWLVDAALQYQPYMFTTAFPREVIRPAADGNPAWVSGPLEWSATLLADHIVVLNAAFATVQLLIALGLFWRRTVQLALAGSIVWALMVWWLGEGLGEVLTGAVSPLSGLPGAVLLYAVVAVLLWPPAADAAGTARGVRSPRSVALGSPLRSGALVVWLVLWLGFAAEMLLPANQTDWRAGAWLLAACFVMIGCSVLGPFAIARAGVALAVVLSLIIWAVAQDFGGITTGQATDPNTGPILALLAACFWPVARTTVRTRRGAAPAGDR